jgi:ATP-binding cassette subfamily A (ABC1) protein 3
VALRQSFWMNQVIINYLLFIKKFLTNNLIQKGSGMDPQARHTTWNLLKKFKNENKCTILLTTHYMDEADYLGDRIAIMSKGNLRCSGSPLFLKSKYSSGYRLVLTIKQQEENAPIPENKIDFMKANKLIELVQKIIPNAKLNSNINSEITFILSAENSKTFPRLFEELDKHKEDLNLINVGISAATVEQVFLK